MEDSEERQPGRIARWTSRIAIGYASFALAFVVLTVLDGEILWPLEFLDAMTHVVLLPAPFVAAIAVLRDRRHLAAASLLATLYLAVTCGTWIGGNIEPVPIGDKSTLRVLTWNLGLGICDVDQVADEVLRVEADVVLLQEARIDQARGLFERLGETLPHFEHFKDDRFSKAYLSRIEPANIEFTVPEDTKNFLEVTVPFDDQAVTIASFHTNKTFAVLGYAWSGAPRMMEQIDRAAGNPHNLVVGDFNMTERNGVYGDFVELGLIDSYRELHADPGFTFPTFGRYRDLPLPPLIRIDYLWHTPDMRCVAIERTDASQSDHCGLVGTFILD